jgi:SAM-dependent methyltransferase
MATLRGMPATTHGSMPAWNSREIVDDYRGRSYLTPAEMACLGEVWGRFKGGAVLDIGVGAGRTVPFLRPLARSYVAVDAAAEMVRVCRARFPDVEVREADARDLREFADGSFDLVVFSFNGMDYMPPEDRPRSLEAVFRVLRPGGAFVFSSHNLGALDPRSMGRFVLPQIRWTPRPLKLAGQMARAAFWGIRSWRNHQRLASAQRVEKDFAFINDGAHAGALLTCYTRPASQIAALREAGFDLLALFGLDGRALTPALAEEARDNSLHFVVRKPVSAAGDGRAGPVGPPPRHRS